MVIQSGFLCVPLGVEIDIDACSFYEKMFHLSKVDEQLYPVKFIKILLFVFRFYSHYLWQLKPQGGVVLLHIFASV